MPAPTPAALRLLEQFTTDDDERAFLKRILSAMAADEKYHPTHEERDGLGIRFVEYCEDNGIIMFKNA